MHTISYKETEAPVESVTMTFNRQEFGALSSLIRNGIASGHPLAQSLDAALKDMSEGDREKFSQLSDRAAKVFVKCSWLDMHFGSDV